MEVFNKQIFGVDAERFLAKTSEEKKEWILKHTNQRNESIINKFIERLPQVPPKEKECLNCGTLNDKIENPFKDGESISSGNVTTTSDDKQGVVTSKGNRNGNRRPRKPKKD